MDPPWPTWRPEPAPGQIRQIDRAFPGVGDDYVAGGPGDDYVRGGPGDDTVRGGPGDDRLLGGKGTNLLIGRDSNDTCGAPSLR